MGAPSRPRHGSLQFYPRKRVRKFLHSVNWSTIKGEEGILGFIAYKAGMASALVKDNTENSMTKGKQVTIPVTILEVPAMKVFAIRFIKNKQAVKDIIVSDEKELKRKLTLPNEKIDFEKNIPKEYDDIRIIVYSLPKTTAIKKTPDITELAINSNNKLEFAKSLIGKEITLSDFSKYSLVDIRGLTKGKGTVSSIKRFGLDLKGHKSEKGVRRAGSLGPWHPARVTFLTPMAGQMGTFSRIHYNFKVIYSNSIDKKDINPPEGFKQYGKIKTSYIMLKGSVQGPQKRQVILTPSFRPTKEMAKKKYEFLEVLR